MRQGIVTEFRHIHATHRHPHRGATPATMRRCDIAPAAAGATDRLATIDPFAELAEAPRPSNAKGAPRFAALADMRARFGDADGKAGLVTFIVCYFAMFWVAWRPSCLALRGC
jgi:hypothetical protein